LPLRSRRLDYIFSRSKAFDSDESIDDRSDIRCERPIIYLFLGPAGKHMPANGSQMTRSESAASSIARNGGTHRRPKTIKGFTALVVDDNPGMGQLAAGMLRKLGYEVRVAGEGAEALFHFQSAPCELVLTDYEMPAINGYQLGRRIKSQSPGTRVLIMTGLGRAAVSGIINDQGIDGWLFKPFYLEELRTLLSQVGLPPASPPGPDRLPNRKDHLVLD
jgi:CheY-like chemotaxis protein